MKRREGGVSIFTICIRMLMCVGKIFEVCFQTSSFLCNNKGFLKQLLSISFCEVLSPSTNMLPHSSPMTPTYMYTHTHTSPKSDSEWQDVDKGIDLEDTEEEHSEVLKSLRKEVPE